jgi:hypothetical protein
VVKRLEMGVVGRLRQILVGAARGATSAFRGPLREAHRLEAAGRLEDATARFLEAGSRNDAARLYELRADSTADAPARCRLLAQAAAVAQGAEGRRLRVRRAALLVDLAREKRFQLTRGELQALARELEELDEPTLAAQAFELAGDVDGQARALVQAGAVERLEEVLDAEQQRVRSERRRLKVEREVGDLHQSGRRRDALVLRDVPEAAGVDGVSSVLREIELRRPMHSTIRLRVAGEPFELALGDDLTIGRADTSIVVQTPALSRSHLRVRRGVRGPEALDLGSRNGTTLGGARLDIPAVVPESGRLELVLGGEVSVAIERWQSGVLLDVAGRSVHAPLGPWRVGGWRLEMAPDGWIDLTVIEGELFLHELRVGARVQLCRGDVFRAHAGGPPVLEVLE